MFFFATKSRKYFLTREFTVVSISIAAFRAFLRSSESIDKVKFTIICTYYVLHVIYTARDYMASVLLLQLFIQPSARSG